ncbi:hypothetical protein GCM10018953_60510 [Streptosporangium nondiastaticum]
MRGVQPSAQQIDRVVELPAGGVRRVLLPQDVDENVHRDQAIGVEEESGEQPLLPWSAQTVGYPVDPYFQWT